MIDVNNIKEVRENLDLSQADICKEAKVSQSYLSALENGLVLNPSRKMLNKIEEAILKLKK